MKRKNVHLFLLMVALLLILAACNQLKTVSDIPQTPVQLLEGSDNGKSQEQPVPTNYVPQPDGVDLPRQDVQGAVIVVITPLNLGQPGDTLDFEVQMDTHSVDLNMDLAELASLATDTGIIVSPVKWDAPAGGHHVSGILSFPTSMDDAPLLDGATSLNLTLRDVDVPERTFTWQIPTD